MRSETRDTPRAQTLKRPWPASSTSVRAVVSAQGAQADPQQFLQHLPPVAQHAEARLRAVMPLDRHLDDAQPLCAGDRQYFHVERPAVHRDARKDAAHGIGREHLEAALRVLDAWE